MSAFNNSSRDIGKMYRHNSIGNNESMWPGDTAMNATRPPMTGDFLDYSDFEDDLEFNHTTGEMAVISLMVLFYISFFIFCGIGNIALIVVTLKLRKLHTSTNLLFLNLVASDSLVALLLAPLMIDYLVTESWNSGQFMCKIAEFTKRVSMFVSINSLVVIALDRLRAVSYPLKGTMGIKSAGISIISIWIVSAALSIPRILFASSEFCTHQSEGNRKCYCLTEWKIEAAMTLQEYTCILFAIEYVLPLFVMSLSYSFIGYKVWKRPMVGTVSAERVRAQIASRKRVIRLLIIVVLVFAIFWMPYQIYVFQRDFLVPDWHSKFKDPLQEIAVYYPIEAVALSNGLFNTFMYIIINDYLKDCIKKQMLCCLFKRTRRRNNQSDDNFNKSQRLQVSQGGRKTSVNNTEQILLSCSLVANNHKEQNGDVGSGEEDDCL
ncbi:prokineticin receptor 2-like [Tubulanus polymorphus]|uniref:prokineticin receptor 2-like n=1 Tax=Tubulanus polymorphus TaxID=672921 RepID=UPI003DA5E430